MKVNRVYKYRFYPDPEQAQLLAKTFGCVRLVHNYILRYRTDAFYQAKEKVGYTSANAKLTEIKQKSLSFLFSMKFPAFLCSNVSDTSKLRLRISLKAGLNTLSLSPRNANRAPLLFRARLNTVRGN
jgi:transposase